MARAAGPKRRAPSRAPPGAVRVPVSTSYISYTTKLSHSVS
jgi:hypothetical protein